MTVLTTARGAAIGYDAFGDPADPPLVLIQGFSAQRIGWPPDFCRALAALGLHVIRFDNRDVGESERHPGETYGLTDLAQDTVDLLDALDLGSVHLVGQSMGGMVAQIVAAEHPSRVRSLGLLYTTASIRHVIGAEAVTDRVGSAVPPTTREEFVAAYVRDEATCASPGYAQDTVWLTELGGQMWDRGVDPTAIERQMHAVLALGDRAAAARTITAPTTIIAGDGDGLIDPAASVELHDLVPGSVLHLFPGMGHELPVPLRRELASLLASAALRV